MHYADHPFIINCSYFLKTDYDRNKKVKLLSMSSFSLLDYSISIHHTSKCEQTCDVLKLKPTIKNIYTINVLVTIVCPKILVYYLLVFLTSQSLKL